MTSVQGLLRHKLRLVEGLTIRVSSMESQVQDIINLVQDPPDID